MHGTIRSLDGRKGAADVTGGIRLYALDVRALTDETVFARALSCALPERREKIGDIKMASDRRRSLGAHLLLAWALKQEDIDIARERFGTNEKGKPVCLSRADLKFNLSHAGCIALCAVSPAPVGCDAERIGRVTPALARRCFSPEEIRLFGGEQDETGLCRLWTLKESVLKCAGTGLAFPMREVKLALGPEGPSLLSGPEEGTFDLYEFALLDCRIALCAKRTAKTRQNAAFSVSALANILEKCYNITI